MSLRRRVLWDIVLKDCGFTYNKLEKTSIERVCLLCGANGHLAGACPWRGNGGILKIGA